MTIHENTYRTSPPSILQAAASRPILSNTFQWYELIGMSACMVIQPSGSFHKGVTHAYCVSDTLCHPCFISSIHTCLNRCLIHLLVPHAACVPHAGLFHWSRQIGVTVRIMRERAVGMRCSLIDVPLVCLRRKTWMPIIQLSVMIRFQGE